MGRSCGQLSQNIKLLETKTTHILHKMYEWTHNVEGVYIACYTSETNKHTLS
jgi:hypothetical protein